MTHIFAQVVPAYMGGDMRDPPHDYALLADNTQDLSQTKTGMYLESNQTAMFVNTPTQRTAACNNLRTVFPEWRTHSNDESAFAFKPLLRPRAN